MVVYLSESILKIAVAQLNLLVGDIEGNCTKILSAINTAKLELNADCIVFSELSTIGYPPEDLLFRSKVLARVNQCVDQLKNNVEGITVIVGTPFEESGDLYNSALVLQNKCIVARYHKMILPNYNVFDEKRYFSSGIGPCVVSIKGISVGITICEDIWTSKPARLARQQGAELIININASPYYAGKQQEREEEVRQRISENGVPIIYVNQVGGQDELVFEGYSFASNKSGNTVWRASECEEEITVVDFSEKQKDLILKKAIELDMDLNRSIYSVLVFGLREYVEKNGFKGGMVGLSGGIDSALALTLAVDALGRDRVHAVMMPSRFTSQISLDDARTLVENLNVRYSSISIESIYDAFEESLKEVFAGTEKDTTEENIQARIRGVLLMAMSNKFHYMVISTGNKSEMAVGYATLYGDMAGGFAPLKDVPKTKVFELARYRNRDAEIIPQRIIDRPPSAELAFNQKDEDSLPPYSILDEILEQFIEQDKSRDEIIARGFERDTVAEVIHMVFRNEYKRRQAPPGVKISKRAFGKDRRYPITSGVLKYLD